MILSVNSKAVSSAADAARELQKIAGGPHRADARLARRRRSLRPGQEGIAIEFRLQISDCRLRDVIRERGPLTVAAFMDLALYDSELGYYARAAQRSGRAGDFFTSVDVGPLFGELLEIQLAEMSGILEFRIPGFTRFRSRRGRRGERPARRRTSCARRARRDPAFYESIRLHLVEASAEARAAQRGDARRRGRPARLVGRRAARVVRGRPARERAARRVPGAPGGDARRRPARGVRRRVAPRSAERLQPSVLRLVEGPAVDAGARRSISTGWA